MSIKTTFGLFVTLVVLVAAYLYVVRSRPASIEATTAAAAPTTSAATRDVLPKKLGDVVKVVYRRPGGEEWVFEKSAGETKPNQSSWKMTSPLEMSCISWEVDKFGRDLGGLQYEISYKPGDPGAVKPADAGLEPPEAVVTLTDAEGRSAAVEIGRPAPGRGATYVRLVGDPVIYLGRSDLKGLLKSKPIDFRDKLLWTFANKDVARVEVDDRTKPDTPVSYAFVRDGERWMMQSPVTARATGKVDELLTAMSQLRVANWHDSDPARLPIFGLEPAAWTVRVTVDETVDSPDKPDAASTGEKETAEKEGDKPSEPPQSKTIVYALQIADVSPIGEDTKTYVRVAGENAVATLMKSVADKFKPSMNEWRDMKITNAKVNDAVRVEIKNPDGAAVLLKKDAIWTFEGDAGRADPSAVGDLLKAVGDMTAVSFAEDESADPAALGLASPRAEIRLTIPGVEGMEKIAVGAFTDETAKRLVYVRRNDLTSIAKVRADDVRKLQQGPAAYRDRTIVDVVADRFTRIVLSTENKFIGGRNETTFEKHDGLWRMTAPSGAEVKLDAFNKLVQSFGSLRAEGIAGDGSVASSFGLSNPPISVAIIYQAVGETGAELASSAENTTPPPAAERSLRLALNEHEGKYYAVRDGGPSVFEVKKELYQQLQAEFRTDRALAFDDSTVRGFTVRRGGTSLAFEKQGDRWLCLAEPDLPLDSTKVKNLIVQFRDLKTPRYVQNAASDLSRFGLTTPSTELLIVVEGGAEHGLLVSEQVAEAGIERGNFAVRRGENDVFLLPPDAAQRLTVSLATLEKDN